MALKKNLDSLDKSFDMLSSVSDQVKESKKKQRDTVKQFKKPRGDYYNLDMVVRETVTGPKGHPVITEGIKTDYKQYVATMAAASGLSITKYIHKLIDEDMEKNKDVYKKLNKLSGK